MNERWFRALLRLFPSEFRGDFARQMVEDFRDQSEEAAARRGPLVVVGDSLLDIDIEGDANRLSPEAPVPVVDIRRQRRRPAGGPAPAASG